MSRITAAATSTARSAPSTSARRPAPAEPRRGEPASFGAVRADRPDPLLGAYADMGVPLLTEAPPQTGAMVVTPNRQRADNLQTCRFRLAARSRRPRVATWP